VDYFDGLTLQRSFRSELVEADNADGAARQAKSLLPDRWMQIVIRRISTASPDRIIFAKRGRLSPPLAKILSHLVAKLFSRRWATNSDKVLDT
jgi:hypothetical protein